MMMKNNSKQSTSPTSKHIDFHGASVIDKNGKETPITEEMIQRSLHLLMIAWEKQHNKNQSH